MTDKYDFKAALEDFEGVPSGIPDHRFGDMWIDGDINHKTYKAIQTALRLADRLQSGEVSKKMYEAGCDCDNYVGDYIDGIDIERADCKEHWQAMAGQMMMEESE